MNNQAIPLIYVTVSTHAKSTSVQIPEKSSELVREAGADKKSLEARQRRLTPSVQKLLTGPYGDIYSFLNTRYPNIGGATFVIPAYSIGVDGTRTDVWPAVERKIEETRALYERGILKVSEMIENGSLAGTGSGLCRGRLSG